MIARASLIVAALACADCSDPNYGNGHLQCANATSAARACPADFYCAGDQHCWRVGTPRDDGGSDDMGDLALIAGDLTGSDLPAKGCAASSALLCDEFETTTINTQWSQDIVLGTIALDTTRAHSGIRSVHFHTNGGAAGTKALAALRESRTFTPAITTTAYARAWVYLPAAFAPEFTQTINFTDAVMTGMAYAFKAGHAVLNDYATPSAYVESTTAIPNGRWTCITFQVSQSAATGVIKMGIDGVDIADVAQTNAATTTIKDMIVGLDFAGTMGSSAADMWLDDVIVDNKPILCSD